MIIKRIFSITIFSFYLISLPSEARLYKWIDDNGQVKYGDQIPKKYANKKHQQLDKQGRIIVTKEAGKSPALIKKERAEAKKKKQAEEYAKKLAEEQRIKQNKQDRILLLTFNSEDEIFYSRNQRLAVIDSKIQLLSKSKQSAQQKLIVLDAKAATEYRSKNLEVPGGLQQKIENLSKNILSTEKNIRLSQHKRAEVEANFQKNLVRFRDLKARQRKQQNDRRKK